MCAAASDGDKGKGQTEPLMRPGELPDEGVGQKPPAEPDPLLREEPAQPPQEAVAPVEEPPAPMPEEPIAGRVGVPPPPDPIVPPALARLRRRLKHEVGLYKMHAKRCAT